MMLVQHAASKEYFFVPGADESASPAWEAHNPADDIDVRHAEGALHLFPRELADPWRWSIRLSRYGCSSRTEAARAGIASTEGNRIAFDHWTREDEIALTSWYLNGALGVEQGFTIHEAPECLGQNDGTLVLDFETETDLDAHVLYDGEAVSWSRDGNTRLWYKGLYATDAEGHVLPISVSTVGTGLTLRVIAEGAIFPLTIDPLLTTSEGRLVREEESSYGNAGLSTAIDGSSSVIGAPGIRKAYAFTVSGSGYVRQAEFVPAGAVSNGEFGLSVDISGDYAIVGARSENAAGLYSGAAYVYRRASGTWRQEARIVPADAQANDGFGTSVSISGTTAVVGSPYDDDDGSNQGTAYVFTRSGTSWLQQAKLKAGIAGQNGIFGASVSIDGDTAVIGGRRVFAFVRSGTSWSLQQQITHTAGQTDDAFGSSVSVQGNLAVVGAYLQDASGTDSGAAYVFARSGTTWSQQQRIVAADAAAYDHFGRSVSIQGSFAVVGAPGEDDGGSGAGAAYVYYGGTGTWVQQAKHTGSTAAGHGLGSSVAMGINNLLAGAPDDDTAGAGAGSAHRLVPGTGNWPLDRKLFGGYSIPNSKIGTSVAVEGTTAVVGVPGESAHGINEGAVLVFDRSTSTMTWSQRARVLADDAAAGDQLGASLAISGSTFAAGSPFHDAAAIDSGAVYVFNYDGTVWGQQQKVTANDGQASDHLGAGLDVEGDTLVATASGDDDQGSNAGAAYVFERSGSTWTQKSKLHASDAAASWYFGSAIDLHGEWLVVSSVGRAVPAIGAGAVYVFRRVSGAWQEQQILVASDPSSIKAFGQAVALGDDKLLVGAAQDSEAASNAGAVYAFTLTANGWQFQAKHMATDAAIYDQFGSTAAMSSSLALIGVPERDDGGVGAGTVYALSHSDGVGWLQQTRLNAADRAAGDKFGTAVAIHLDTAIVGAPNKAAPYGNSGAAYAYRLRLTYGEPCTADAQCQDGICHDNENICCDSQCSSPCFACSASLKESGNDDGLCGPAKTGTDPFDRCPETDPSTCGNDGWCNGQGACSQWSSGTSCGAPGCDANVSKARVCDGLGYCDLAASGTDCGAYACVNDQTCPTSCQQDSDCTSGNYCTTSNTCVPKQANGLPCTSVAQCATGHCVDGVCCNQACTGTCMGCSAAVKGWGTSGDCGFVTVGTDLRNDCTDKGTSSCQTDGMCDGQGACRLYAAGTPCGPTLCQANQVFGQVCDGSGLCSTNMAGIDCAPYVCANGACADPCTTGADCLAGYFCSAQGQCLEKGIPGTACATAEQCASDFCVDGVCCDQACTSTCQACSAALKASGADDGVCGTAANGLDPHNDCPDDGPVSCARDGSCDGNGQCRYYEAGTPCGATTCAGTTLKGKVCSGTGVCELETQGVSCEPYVCRDGACAKPCGQDIDCINGHHCSSGECLPKSDIGIACASHGACLNGLCVDGFCCNSPCNGQCEACDVDGKVGTCSPVEGIPHGAREHCAGAGPCAGACDGTQTTACAYPGSVVVCDASCEDVHAITSTCNGAGVCEPGTAKDCTPFVCIPGSGCGDTCVGDQDCASGFECNAEGQCVSSSAEDAGVESGTEGGAGSGGSSPAGKNSVESDNAGCGCRTAGSAPDERPRWLVLVGLALLLATRRRSQSKPV
jgi:MYXO-CTERM domain-containing protein